ncbi:MAG: PHP domain-containing protein [bacterium]
MSKLINLTIHLHTNFSDCSNISVGQMLAAAKKSGINALIVTDHNTTSGAIALRNLAGNELEVYVGEEISTAQGEIIGLFLKSNILGYNKTLKEVIREIKAQGGLVMIPHPFDYIRKGIASEKLFFDLAKEIDLFETYNARCLPWFNLRAARFFPKLQLLNPKLQAIVGPDAHFLSEINNVFIQIKSFKNPQQFLNNLKKAKTSKKFNYFFWYNLLRSKLRKVRQGMKR